VFEPRHHRVEDAGSGLLAFIVIDDTSLGPAAGGIRTAAYASEEAALADARALARAMTYKCALAGLPAGGGKGVVMLQPRMDRVAAFERLGQFIESLDGEFVTAGDLGTTAADLAAMASRTSHVHTDEPGLAGSVGRACTRSMQACVALRTPEAVDLAGVRVAVQGCGTVGRAVAAAARQAGAEVLVADIDKSAADATAAAVGASVIDPGLLLAAEVDILAPCAAGGVIDDEVVGEIRAWAVCGAANNILSSPAVETRLAGRGVLWVPDPISSSGAVIEGIGRSVLGLADCSMLVDRVYDTTRRVLEEARRRRRMAGEVALALAEERVREGRAV
jgi:leucine dehydrogenase